MPTGEVKWFGTDNKHFGFIVPDAGGPDLFVHVSAVGAAGLREIRQGDRLEYTVELDERSKRPCAANLRIIN